MIKLTTGERLKDERVNNKLTTQQVCDLLKEKFDYKLSVGKLNEIESDVEKDFGYRAFVYLAKLYDVSTDYILGLTETKTPKTSIRAICNYTGLNEHAVEKLHNLNIGNKATWNLIFISRIINCNKFEDIIYRIINLATKKKISDIIKEKENKKGEPVYIQMFDGSIGDISYVNDVSMYDLEELIMKRDLDEIVSELKADFEAYPLMDNRGRYLNMYHQYCEGIISKEELEEAYREYDRGNFDYKP